MNLELSNIDRAALRLLALKEQEAQAKAAREKAEQELLALVDKRDEGTVRADTDMHKIAVRYAMTRSVDADTLAKVAPQIPEAIGKRLLRWKPELVTSEVRYIEANEPEIYAIVAQAMTVKPSKPSITIEAIESIAKAA